MPKNLDNGPGEFRFPGFHKPNYTLVPDELFDELLAVLSGAELKVLMYIIRRTFGFKKDADNISLSQMLRGISTSDGRELDKGTGLSKPTLLQALRSLQEKNIIYTERNRSVENGDEPTTYRLNVGPKGTEIRDNDTRGKKTLPGGVVKKSYSPLVKKHDTQDRVIQKTEESDNSNIRNKFSQEKTKRESLAPTYEEDEVRSEAIQTDTLETGTKPVGNSLAEIKAWQKSKKSNLRTPGNETLDLLTKPASNGFSGALQLSTYQHRSSPVAAVKATQEDREVIGAYIADIAREFHDDAPLKSSVTRAVHLFEESGYSRPTFVARILEAKSVTKESSGSIRKKSTSAQSAFTLTNRMPYYFQVLSDKCALKEKVKE